MPPADWADSRPDRSSTHCQGLPSPAAGCSAVRLVKCTVLRYPPASIRWSWSVHQMTSTALSWACCR